MRFTDLPILANGFHVVWDKKRKSLCYYDEGLSVVIEIGEIKVDVDVDDLEVQSEQ